MATTKNADLSPEELKAKRSEAAKKAAATRAANKAAAEETPVAKSKATSVAIEVVAEKAPAKTKAKKAVATDVAVAEAPAKKKAKKVAAVLIEDDQSDSDAPGDRIDHDAWASDFDYDEPFETDPNAPDADIEAEARNLIKGSVAKAKKEKKAAAPEKAEKPNKKARKREQEAFEAEVRNPVEAFKAQAKIDVKKYEIDRTETPDGHNPKEDGRPSFKELGLIEPLQRAVADMGFEYPTVIQAEAIPILLESNTDLVGLAQTGTGKTAAFGLPALNRIHVRTRVPQVLILAPTRELCLQITVEMVSFSKHMPEVSIASVYGGADIIRQIKQIRQGVQIVVATPGRLRDLIRRRAIDLQHVEYLILDEADEMLNMGFKEEIDDILTSIPDEAKTWLFSATMPAEVRRIASEYMTNPAEVQSGERNSSNADISHRYVITRPSERFPVLRRFLDYDPDMYGLIFVRTRMDANEFSEKLASEGYSVDALHGDLSQSQRDNVMASFRNKRLQVLVATDVAARGIDVTGITHVFHLNLPDDLSFYTHRAGRTGRAGAEGVSIALVHPKDTGKLRSIERQIKTRFQEVTIPSGNDIIQRRLLSDMRRLRAVRVTEGLDEYLPEIEEALDGLDREAIIKLLASRTFEKLFNDYRFAPDLNDKRGRDSAKRGERDDRDSSKKERGNDENMERLFINVGGADVGGRKGNLLAMLCDASGITGRDIGRITMNQTSTFFDVDKSVAQQVIAKLGELHFDGRPVRINVADSTETHAPAERSGGRFRERDGGGGRGRSRDGGGRDRESGGGRSRDRDDRGGRSGGGDKRGGKRGRW